AVLERVLRLHQRPDRMLHECREYLGTKSPEPFRDVLGRGSGRIADLVSEFEVPRRRAVLDQRIHFAFELVGQLPRLELRQSPGNHPPRRRTSCAVERRTSKEERRTTNAARRTKNDTRRPPNGQAKPPERRSAAIVKPADIVIIGGGCTGLVAAAFLASRGLKTLVLERSEKVGGCARSGEIVPEFTGPTLAHSASIDPDIMRRLGLVKHGLRVVRSEADVCAPTPDGRTLVLWHDHARAAQQIRAFSAKDAEAYPQFLDSVARISTVLREVASTPPPSIDSPG